MDSQCRTILDAALALSEGQRAQIAEVLLATLTPEDAGLLDDELAAELDTRLAELQVDPSATVPWSQLRNEG